MKLLNLFMVGALALALVACKGSGKDALIGSWGVEDVDMSEMLNGLSDEEKAMYEAFLPMMQEAFKSMEFTFNADGTMETKASMMGQDNNTKGTWTLSDDGKTLTTESEGKKEEIKVESLSSSEMVLAMNVDGTNMKLKMKKK